MGIVRRMLRRVRDTAVGVFLGIIAAAPLVVFAGWTTPRTWMANEIPSAALFNTQFRDNLDFLKTESDNAPRYVASGHDDVQVAGGVETTLVSQIVAADTLDIDGERLIFEALFDMTNNPNENKEIKVKWAGTTCYTRLVSSGTGYNQVRGVVARLASGTAGCWAYSHGDSSGGSGATISASFGSSQTLAFTGLSSPNNQLTLKWWELYKHRQP